MPLASLGQCARLILADLYTERPAYGKGGGGYRRTDPGGDKKIN